VEARAQLDLFSPAGIVRALEKSAPSHVAAPGRATTSVLATNLVEDGNTEPPRIPHQTIVRRREIDPWPFQETQDHPGYGLSPKRVLRIFRESEAGNLAELSDLYDDLLESDGHLKSVFEGRISAVASRNRSIEPGGPDAASVKAAELLGECLEN
jgi:phage gp29-like protein